MLSYDIGSVFFGIFTVVVIFVLGEVFNRLFYEFFMLIVKMWRNMQDIRSAIVGYDALETAPASSGSIPVSDHRASVDSQWSDVAPEAVVANQQVAAPMTGDSSKTNPLPVVQVSSQQDEINQTASWSCPVCGASNKAGSFCAQCGNRRS